MVHKSKAAMSVVLRDDTYRAVALRSAPRGRSDTIDKDLRRYYMLLEFPTLLIDTLFSDGETSTLKKLWIGIDPHNFSKQKLVNLIPEFMSMRLRVLNLDLLHTVALVEKVEQYEDSYAQEGEM